MGDFLTRLSDRALGAVPVARSRVLPLFDPGPVLPAEAPAMPGGGISEAAPPDAEPRSSAPASRQEPSHPPPLPMVAPLQSAARPASAPPRETRPVSGSKPREAGQPPEAAQASRPLPEHPTPVSAAPQQQPRPAPPELVGKADTDAETPDPRLEPTFAAVVAPPPSRSPGNSDSAKDRASDGGEASRPQAAPTIHVTIGRVEVRAVMPPPARERRPRQSALMSLEDHLKQGRGQP